MIATDQHEQSEHHECFGQMFPKTLHASKDKKTSGHTFSFLVSSAGGVGVTDREVMVDLAAWDRCNQCSEFKSCYKLSLGLLTLEAAVASA